MVKQQAPYLESIRMIESRLTQSEYAIVVDLTTCASTGTRRGIRRALITGDHYPLQFVTETEINMSFWYDRSV